MASTLVCGLGLVAQPQERVGSGQAGGGFGGGGFGGTTFGSQGRGGGGGARTGTEAEADRVLSQLLGNEMQPHILTPGDFTEWKVAMKADNILLAEARSTAFDAGLEVVDDAGKTLAANDDRYPGDQRPLLLFRAPADGTYTLRGRSFRDRAGGQYELRYGVFPSFLVAPGAEAEIAPGEPRRVMGRVSLAQGAMAVPYASHNPGGRNRADSKSYLGTCLSPGGVPDTGAMSLFRQAADGAKVLYAPVAGEYYFLATVETGRPTRLGVEMLEPVPVKPGSKVAVGPGHKRRLYTFDYEPGEILELYCEGIGPAGRIEFEEMPSPPPSGASDLFDPRRASKQPEDEPPYELLVTRARDESRVGVRAQNRVRLLAKVSTYETTPSPYTLHLRNVALPLPRSQATDSQISIGEAEYWIFEAEPGQFLRLTMESSEFAPQFILRRPNGQAVEVKAAGADSTSCSLNHFVSSPGTYTLRASCIGDGGKGRYRIRHEVAPARRCAVGAPAEGTLGMGGVQVVRLEIEGGVALLAELNGEADGLWMQSFDLEGSAWSLPFRRSSMTRQYALLFSTEPLTLLLVLHGTKDGVKYRLDLKPLP